ncbi:MAG: transporter substrate-binding domain-containing protein [Lachnospiraceae bacterium]
MKKFRKITTLLLAVVLGTGLLTACGSGSSEQSRTGEGSNIKVVKAATSGAPSPYIIVEEDGSLSGYDVEVVNELFSRLPDYEVEWEITEFASIFTGLDSGYYQLGVNHFGFNTERAEKYLYSDVIAIDPVAILVKDNNTDIQSVYDLPGHTTEASATSYYLSVFDNFNATHEEQIDYVFVEDPGQTPLHVSDGTIDFEIFTKTTLESQVSSLGLTDVKLINVSNEENAWLTSGVESPSGTFYLISKEEAALAEALNKAFEEAVQDGTIQKLAVKYLGATEDSALTTEQIEETRALIESLTK